MADLIETMLGLLDGQLPGRVSQPGDDRYAAATAICLEATRVEMRDLYSNWPGASGDRCTLHEHRRES